MLDSRKMYTILIVFIVAMFFIVTGAVFYANDTDNNITSETETQIPVDDTQENPRIKQKKVSVEPSVETKTNDIVEKRAAKEDYIAYLNSILNNKWKSICNNNSTEPVASYELVLTPSGGITNYRVKETGINYGKYKNILTRVINNLAPLKPLPEDIENPSFSLVFQNNGSVLVSLSETNQENLSNIDNKTAYMSYLSEALTEKWEQESKQTDSEELVEGFLLALNSDGSVISLKTQDIGSYVGEYTDVINQIVNNLAPYKPLPSDFENDETVFNLNFLANGKVTIEERVQTEDYLSNKKVEEEA